MRINRSTHEILKAVFPDGKPRLSIAPLTEKMSSSSDRGGSPSKLRRKLVKLIETETGASFDKWKRKMSEAQERELEEVRNKAKQEQKQMRAKAKQERKKNKPELPNLALLEHRAMPAIPEIEVVIESVPEAVPLEAIPEVVPEVAIPELSLDVAYRRSPIKDHPHALDYALIAMSLVCRGTMVAMNVAYKSVSDRLQIFNYIDSPECHYQEENRLLTTLRQSLTKAGLITCENKQIAITELGLRHIQRIVGTEAKPIEPIKSTLEPIELTLQPTSKVPESTNENAELIQLAQEELETLGHALTGIEGSLSVSRSKLVAAQSEYDKLLRRKADVQRKQAALQAEIILWETRVD